MQNIFIAYKFNRIDMTEFIHRVENVLRKINMEVTFERKEVKERNYFNVGF